MIREKQPQKGPIIIDLTGPDGNAFALMALGKRLAQQLDLDWEYIRDQMTDGDYEWLIRVFDSYFGDYVILER